jgi:hypothetical protein
VSYLERSGTAQGATGAHTFSPGQGGSVSKKQRHFGPNPDTETYRVRFLQKTGLIVLEGKPLFGPSDSTMLAETLVVGFFRSLIQPSVT